MASVTFTIASKKNPASIYVRFRDGREIDYKSKTGKTINPNYWGKSGVRRTAEFTDKINLEDDLNKLESLLFTERNRSITKGTTIDKDWFLDVIRQWKGENSGLGAEYLKDFLELYRDEVLPNKVFKDRRGASKGTIKNYTTTIRRLDSFEKFKKKKYKLTDVDLKFHSQFINYLSTELSLLNNSIYKDISQIKAVARYYHEQGFNINQQVLFKGFRAPREKRKFHCVVNERELNLIANYQGKEYLENVRDSFIVGFWTAMRNGDWIKLNAQVLKGLGNRKTLTYIQNKTGKEVKVPLHPMVLDVLERRGGFPRVISNQKFNRYLKELCKIVGINKRVETRNGYKEKWEVIASHDCRRSFATHFYNKLSNKVIMAVTGHATERQLLEYIGEIESDHLEDFYNLWEVKSDSNKSHISRV